MSARADRMLIAADEALRFVLDPYNPAFVHLAASRAHLRSLPADRRAQLEREWHEGGFGSLSETTPDSLKARAAAEWREHTGEGLYD